jgi:hypothetical protein
VHHRSRTALRAGRAHHGVKIITRGALMQKQRLIKALSELKLRLKASTLRVAWTVVSIII